MRYLSDLNSIFSIDVVDSLAQQIFELTGEYEYELTISRHVGARFIKGLKKEVELSEEVGKVVAALESLSLLSERYTLSYIELPILNERLLP